MLEYKTFRAGIRVDGDFLNVYDVETSFEENKVTCWIASEAGKNFSVVWQDRDLSRNYNIAGHVKVDGTFAGGMLFQPIHFGQANCYNSSLAELKYINASPTTVRPLAFSKLQLTDEDQYLRSAPPELGEICITMRPVVVTGRAPQAIGPNLNTKVHERAKKAFSHCISFGDEIVVAPQHVVQVHPLTQEPSVTFVFKYRALDRLMADGIAPTPPSLKRAAPQGDSAGDELRDSQADAMHEIAFLKEKVKELEARLDTSQKASEKRVKVERGDVIDLTCS
ncbi:hypothetical protein PAXRUDRAFT_833359 [Paxillus rubicundulus Ve08.2h10]|uniref:DUF7918 domain-containing protein n=1 Tax=Paxillus rubicundulus Ve08.2h10 TaxID=930991 RepID=A0A0D0CDC8_9AGAM|nr:hypothetical protein PAXRUDRAFT_833359 [Paxillus rubicundulus Ve08.2h10]